MSLISEKLDRLMVNAETRIWGQTGGRPPSVWPIFLLIGVVVYSHVVEVLVPVWGSFLGRLVALLYGVAAWALPAGTQAWSAGWARRWHAKGLGSSRPMRRLPGMTGAQFLVMGLPMAAIWPLIHWGHAPKSTAWYALGFGIACTMLLWEQATRGLVPLLQDARSEALRAKLAPHFIFNALNTLKAQIATDPQAAEATADRLAQLFRQVVMVSDAPVISLKEELAFVEAYLGIEQARFGHRLRVSIEVSEDLESAAVPPLSLQVLVENAIKHGVAPLEQGGTVRIGGARKHGVLHLWVEDPGPGFSAQRGTGTALETLRKRLERPEDMTMGMVAGHHRVAFCWRQS
jgi:hypothetical protein